MSRRTAEARFESVTYPRLCATSDLALHAKIYDILLETSAATAIGHSAAEHCVFWADVGSVSIVENAMGSQNQAWSNKTSKSANMSELESLIENAYATAKTGDWDRLLSEWDHSPVLAKRCSRYIKSGSSWTFLHQAAYHGHALACRSLIRLGASTEAHSHDSLTPADVAAQRGYHELAAFIRNASTGKDTLWEPPIDPDVLPSSNRWSEATESRADTELFVAYGGGLVRIPKGATYFVDSLSRVLVGWHGTFNPPCGMDGESMLSRLP